MVVLQKVKSRSAELEKEIEELKSKPAAGGTDDIIQALTERLDAVLLEKAEIHQQCLTLKKENVKRQQEAEAAIVKDEELQKRLSQLSADNLKEIESLKNEMLTAQSRYDETLSALQKELHAEKKKQEELVDQLKFNSNWQEKVKTQEEEVHQTKTVYEQQISDLEKELKACHEAKKKKISSLQNVIESKSQGYQNEIDKLNEELVKLKTSHQEEISSLMHQHEASANVREKEQNKLEQLKQDLREQSEVQVKILQNELHACKEKYECELEHLRQALTKNEENQMENRIEPLETEQTEKTRQLESALKELESQHSMLQNELTYMNNVKVKLEMEVQHMKDEYFHEREDLEFKINELQLAKEEHCCVIEKLKSELQGMRGQCEKTAQEHSLEIQDLLVKHEREMCELQQKLSSSLQKESRSLAQEIQDLKEQCQKYALEKEEAVESYESLRDTMETLQAELGESAGKISREFASMKQQQASDVDELQKKLRAAFSDKDALLETVNCLREEVEQLSCKGEEAEELRLKARVLQEENEKLVASLHQRDAAVKELEEKEQELCSQNISMSDEVKCSKETIENLQEQCKVEHEKVMGLQQQAEAVCLCNHKLEQQVEELKEKLRVTSLEKEESQQKLGELEQQVEVLQQDREHLSSEVKRLCDESNKLKEERGGVDKKLQSVMSEKEEWLGFKEKAADLKMKLNMASDEKDHLEKLLDEEKAFKSLVTSQLCSLLEQMDSRYPDENEGCDVVALLQAARESLARIKQEKQDLTRQKDDNVLLQEELRRLQEENVACLELLSRLDDSEKEKRLLREELEGALSEKEALQQDIQELNHASEKVKAENHSLLACVEDISEKLADHESHLKEQEKTLEEEKKNLKLILDQKESELRNLQAELSFLKNSMAESSAKSDKEALESQKIVNLEKQLKEKEEKSNKIKAVALKLRKELDSSKKEMQSLREELEQTRSEREKLSSSMGDVIQGAEGYKNLLIEFDKQAEQLDFEKERTRNFERQMEDLSRQLDTSIQQQDKWCSANEDLSARIETLQTNAKLLETQLLEMQKAKAKTDKELETEKLLKEQKIKDHSVTAKKVEELQAQLQKERKHLQKVLEELEMAKKDAQKSTLMDMEIADYERLVKELNQKLSDRDSRIEDLEQEIKIQKQKQETLQDEMKSFQATVQQFEDKNSKIKQLLVKTKKELADSKQTENELLRIQASLKGELEASQQQVEVYKIQLADLTSEKHKLQEQLRTSMEQHQRVLSNYQQKLATLQEECSATKAEHAAVSSEFESYKVRVHNVLRQKNKSSQAETDGSKQEREHQEKVIDQLKIKLQDTQHNLQINVAELQALQSEHDTLLERHNKILQETVAKEAELREKLCTIQSENMVMKSEHTQTTSQLTAQNEALRNSFRDQVRHLQEEHRKTVETLQQQLSKVETQLFQLKSEPSSKSPTPSNIPTKNLRERRNTDLPLLDVHTVAREEGEGMETTDTESVSSASTYVPSLEQLLNTPDVKLEPPQWQAELTKEELLQKLNTTTKSADHVNGLLRESEATNVILMEQIKLLKSEIRRLERNQEREKSVANLEYLKNVLLQFIFLKSGSERERLLPVIDTMLQLSPEEKGKLVAIAQGEEESTSQPSAWASYLHSWSGLR
uniref:GRIP and coiled-coil domain-containing protein 2 n=1 Tax=Euleptes europaea TaxID=460621 RepID=UPI002541B8A2|nr:GRIP and coiled-coil domain-containing protein 2 [Euleptes europaea]